MSKLVINLESERVAFSDGIIFSYLPREIKRILLDLTAV